MTRAGDVAMPTLTPHAIGPDAPIAGWRWWPVIGLEMVDTLSYVWDDADPTVNYDDANPDRLVWDTPASTSGYWDAVCDLIVCDIEPGQADDLYLFPPTECTLTLDNSSGRYTPWTADGRLTYWAPGRRVCVWARNAAGARWWLFSGRVATWQANTDGTVTVVAYDGLAQLAQALGGQWAPGFAGDTVAARISTIAGAAGYTGRLDLEAGDVTLTTYSSQAVPLEAIQQAALSDGGLFYGDADGSLDYRNRLWRAGRPDTPAPGWTVATNVCDVGVPIVWDPEAAADDDRLVTDVKLVNTAALTATAALSGSLWQGDARFRLTHTDPDLWTTQAQGNALAAYLLAQQSSPAMALSAFSLYHADPTQPAVADLAVQVRRGDRMEVLHGFVDQAGIEQLLDVFAIVLGVGHRISPEDGWVSVLNLSRTVDYITPEQWDRTAFVWDDPAPAAVWRF